MRFGSEYQSGGAGLLSTVSDFVLLTDALANGGVGKNGARILSRAAVELLSSPALTPEQSRSFELSLNGLCNCEFLLKDVACKGDIILTLDFTFKQNWFT